jgi:hypothetical protein
MHISELTQKYTRQIAEKKEGEPRTQREELIESIMTRLNEEREKGGFTKMTYPRVAKMFKGMNESHIFTLKNECESAKSFGALLKWKLDALKANKTS